MNPLLAWYEPRRAAYPWRRDRDPYRVLVSEFMLQQTQAARVVPAFERFVARFPTVGSLARASRADVLRAWDGLGYNRRAVALHAAARSICERHDGAVPAEVEQLVALPGVGPYTAAAVASVAFGRAVAAIDTNVARVVRRARLGRDDATPMEIRDAAAAWIDGTDPGSWNQAVMDLGREVCRPQPRCDRCPLAHWCRFHRVGRAPIPRVRRQGPFEGSTRQLRGAIVRRLRAVPSATVARLARDVGQPDERIVEVVASLHAEGLVTAGPAALAGRPSGRVRLPV